MLEAQNAGITAAHHFITRPLTPTDIPAILSLQDEVIHGLQPTEKHFLKKRAADYIERLLTSGIGIGTFDPVQNRLVAQALLRRQNFDSCETNCNVNNFLRTMEEKAPSLARILLPELRSIGWGVIGTMLVSPDPSYLKKGLARSIITFMIAEYQRQGGKHLFASTALDNIASQKVFAAHDFARLSEAVDPKDGWRCVILHHPPLPHSRHTD
jgi:RimJ/RimL family protein N-acetyltransferase